MDRREALGVSLAAGLLVATRSARAEAGKPTPGAGLITVEEWQVRASLLLDETTGNLRFHVAKGAAAEGLASAVVKPGKGIVGHVAATGEPLALALFLERANAEGIDAIPLSPALGDFNEDLRRLGIDALCAGVRVQLAPEDIARFMSQAA